MPTRRWLAFGAQAAVTIVLLAFVLRGFDWAEFAGVVRRVPLPLYLVALLIAFAGQVLYAFKWYAAVRAVGLAAGYRRVLAQYFVGIFFNNFLPSTIGGDWARVYYLGGRRHLVAAGASVFIDRYLGASWLAVLAAGLLWLVPMPGTPWVLARTALTGLAAALVGCGLAAVLVPRGRIATRWRGRDGLPGRVAALASGFASHVGTSLRRPFVTVAGAGSVLTYFLMQAFVYQWFGDVVAGVHIDFPRALAAVATIGILSMVPVSLNGLGVREQLHVVLLGSLGISREIAFAISMMLVSQLLVLSVVGLVVWLCRDRSVAAQPSPAVDAGLSV